MMKSLHRRASFLGLAILAGASLTGCEPDPVGPGSSKVDPSFAKQPPPPGFVQMNLGPMPGQLSAVATDINDSHQVVGTVQFGNQMGAAFFWSAASGGLQPELLPNPPGTSASAASNINAVGEVAGTAGLAVIQGTIQGNPVPVIWRRTGSSWTPLQLEGPGLAMGLNDLGEVVGFRKTDLAQMNEEPMFWNAAGVAIPLPMPPGYRQARGSSINNDGDVSGRATTYDGMVWAVLWVKQAPEAWTPVVLDGAEVRGITDRRGDGTLLATGYDGDPGCCIPFRWTIAIDPVNGGVQAVRERLGTDLFRYGAGHAINAAGDVAGYGIKGNNWTGTPQPAFFPAGGSTVKLPIGRTTSGGGVNGISIDRWFAGSVDGQAVVWHPSN